MEKGKVNITYLKEEKSILNVVLQVLYSLIFFTLLISKINTRGEVSFAWAVLIAFPASILYSFIIGYYLNGTNKKYTKEKTIEMYFSNQENYNLVRGLLDMDDINKEDLKYMYDKSVSSEQFYEGTVWTIGSIFITAAFSIVAVSFSSTLIEPYIGILVATGIFFVFLVIFHRFRLSIRLFRNVSRVLEQEMNYFVFRYAYELEFEKYGLVVRIWTVLFSIFLLFVNLTILFI